MITFTLNGNDTSFTGDENLSLLNFLRNEKGITSVKDGCSGQAACGACLVDLDGKPTLACVTKMKRLAGKSVITIEGFPEEVRRTLGRAFQDHHGLQCGFCTPGMVMSTAALLKENPKPSEQEIREYLEGNICRCTGYHNIVKAIMAASGQDVSAIAAE